MLGLGRRSGEGVLLLAGSLVLCGFAPCSTQDDGELSSAFDLASEFERMAKNGSLWPGFEPLKIPLAIYDGKRTLLFRHPSPPAGFSAVAASTPSAHVYPGRHPAVSANTSAEIGGILSATLMYSMAKRNRPLGDLAAVAVHEAFHVYQHGWSSSQAADEGALFLYPFDDERQLTLRRLETEALRRSAFCEDRAQALCWAAKALLFREERFEFLGDIFVAYERGIELVEGLAAYVQLKAAGRERARLPAAGFGASRVRQRGYETGATLALLLDSVRPDWHTAVESGKLPSLDQALAAAIDELDEEPGETCGFTEEELMASERGAAASVAEHSADRARRQEAFFAAGGWRVTIRAAPDEPLWPQGFDPLNVERIDAGILHLRYLRLGNAGGKLEMLESTEADLTALTIGRGAHPLLNGVREFTITGLPRPDWETTGRAATVRCPGFEADFEHAELQIESEHLILQLVTKESTGR